MRNAARGGLVALSLVLGLLAASPETGYGGGYTTVNIGGDTDNGSCNPLNIFVPGTGCTLREAINAANADAGHNTIDFGQFFNAAFVIVISPASALPPITGPTTLDGTTAGAGRVAIDGVNTGSGVDGLRLDADGNTIRGLAIYNFDGSGLESDGIHINSSGNVIENNYIGTDATGSAGGLGNGNGIRVNGAANLGGTGDNNTIGGSSAPQRNIIVGSDTYGIWIRSAADNNTVQGNHIGINAAGTAAIPNSYGVQMHGGTGNVTGGTAGTTPGACTGACNVISGNSTAGIRIDAASNQSVIGNLIGTNAAGTMALPNRAGITVQGNNNLIGGSSANARNVVSGNTEDGVRILADGNTVSGNYVGLNAAGTASLPNGTGISLGHPDDLSRDAVANTVGGLTADKRNIVSGNTGAGIAVWRGEDNTVVGNFIGTDPAGTAVISNLGNGVYVAQPFNTIGGTEGVSPGGACTGACNLISGNGTAIAIEGSSANGNGIYGNHIGVDSAGQPLGNGSGVLIQDASENTVGGTDPAARNVISANSTGLQISGAEAADNIVLGNYIGTGSDGTTPVGNSFFGVRLADGAHDNAIGGAAAVEGNVIAANGTGVRMGDPTTTGNLIQGNFIGTNAAGDGGLGNVNEGIYISNAAGNTIGGEGAGVGNVITNNGAAGVRVQDTDAVANRISSNSIDDNGTLGIELVAGGNEDQEEPVIASAENGTTHVEGSLDSAPNTDYRIEVFASPECDDSGGGEGRIYLGFGNVTTGGGGSAVIDITIPATAAAGDVVTATATDPDGNTSQFSNCVVVTGSATPTPSPTASPTATATATPTATGSVTPTPTGGTSTATPTPTPKGQTPTPTPTPTGDPSELRQGDVQCDDDVDSVDALQQLRDVAGLETFQEDGCPAIGSAGGIFGDVDCDGDVDSVDALKVLRHVAALSVSQEEPCTDIGEPL